MSTLYILGNGFDLAHELNTSYKKFAEILKQKDSTLYNELSDLYFDNNMELWKHFEEKIGHISQKSIKNIEKYIQQKFIDIQKKILNLPKDQILSLNNELGLLDPYGIKITLNNCMKQMVNEANMQLNKTPKVCTKITANDYFITFNYTSTLENLYKINSNHILHVHNKLDSNSKNNELIFGNTDKNIFNNVFLSQNWGKFVIEKFKGSKKLCININEMRERYLDNDEDLLSIVNSIDEHFNELNELFHKKTDVPAVNVKNFSNSISHNISKIHVIGHSLAPVDMKYFEEIKMNIPHATWYVHYFNDMSDIEKSAIKLLGNSYTETICESNNTETICKFNKYFIFSPK